VGVRGDFLVIGSGIAGLRAAISLAEAGDVVMLTKADPRESNTGYAQGGIAAALGPDDSPDLHFSDTLAAGDGLCVPEAVRVLVTDGPRYVNELIAWGVAFDRHSTGAPALGREAAHSVRRVLHARDTPGREIGRVLWQKVQSHPRVRVHDDALAMSLMTDDGVCRGAEFVDRDGQLGQVEAARTLIATGGAGQVFRETTNPAIATGDGIAMAFEAGARVTDLEFIQFHPTALSVEGAPRFLLSEALRGEGAWLVNADGERFVHRYEPAGDLASRDLVARAIVREVERTHAPVYLSMAHLDHDYVRRRFPAITEACRQAGLDLATDRIPVSPAAHYAMGGIESDLDGRTSIAGLFAAGEAACTGVHGANRLASNSLLEGLVFGARAAAAMIAPPRPASCFAVPSDSRRGAPSAFARSTADHRSSKSEGWSGTPATKLPSQQTVRDAMWRHAGLLRSRDSLNDLVAQLSSWWDHLAGVRASAPSDRELRRLSSLVTVGMLIARAALRREESRGGHFRTDFPHRDDIHWQKHVSDVIGSRL
jgi:L-aspartate oxidase